MINKVRIDDTIVDLCCFFVLFCLELTPSLFVVVYRMIWDQRDATTSRRGFTRRCCEDYRAGSFAWLFCFDKNVVGVERGL